MSDTIERFERKLKALTFPERPKSPERGTFPNNEQYRKALDEYEAQKAEYTEKRREYSNQQQAIEEESKQAVAKEFGLVNHPKFEKFYDIAYSSAHSEGFSGIYYEVEKLAVLLAVLLAEGN